MPASTAQSESCVAFSPIPRGEKRRREIAAVAEQVFFENGFTDTTMQMVAARAGASKETLYRHFGSKEGLFAEIVETRAKGFLDGLDQNFEKPGSVASVLRDLGMRIIEALVSPLAIKLCRTVVAESPRNPELGRIFFAEGPNRVSHRLTEFLAAARERGELVCPDPYLAATIFLGAVMASIHLQRLVVQEPPAMTQEQVSAHVDEVVALFLSRYAHV